VNWRKLNDGSDYSKAEVNDISFAPKEASPISGESDNYINQKD